jgi:ribosome maturation factor RimP
MDQPFKILRQYQRYVGREVEMKTTEGDKFKGILISADESAVVLETTRKEKIEGKKKKQIVIENKTVPMEQVKETKVVISFK